MAAKHFTKASVAHRRGGMSSALRLVSAVLGCLWLTAPFAKAMDTSMLTRQNHLTAPYPSSYTKQVLAKFARKVVAPAPVFVKTVAPGKAPARHSVMELAMQDHTDGYAVDHMERNPSRDPSPALMEAIVGQGHATGAHSKIKIGYGKMVTDNSNTVGMKNGTRLEEPGCLYVKTSVNF